MSETVKKATRDGFGDEIVELGKENSNMLVVDVDIGKSCKTGSFRRTFRRADRGAKAYDNAGTGNCVGEYNGWIR